jgi:hypothetical protein
MVNILVCYFKILNGITLFILFFIFKTKILTNNQKHKILTTIFIFMSRHNIFCKQKTPFQKR